MHRVGKSERLHVCVRAHVRARVHAYVWCARARQAKAGQQSFWRSRAEGRFGPRAHSIDIPGLRKSASSD